MTEGEIERLAGAISFLRPDWPAGSIKRFITTRPELAARPLRDLALALTWVALDPTSTTPARVLEAGPWWQILRPETGRDVAPVVTSPECVDHPDHPASACPECLTRAVPAPAGWRTPTPVNLIDPRQGTE